METYNDMFILTKPELFDTLAKRLQPNLYQVLLSALIGECCERELKQHLDIVIQRGGTDWNVGLMRACKAGRLDFVERMIELGANDWSAGLAGACYSGNIQIVELIFSKVKPGVKIDWKRVIVFAYSGHNQQAIDLIEHRMKSIYEDAITSDKLIGACDAGWLTMVKQLLAIEKAPDWPQLMYQACCSGSIPLVNFLVRNIGTTKDVSIWNAGLRGACTTGHDYLVHMMISLGANNWLEGFKCACLSGNVNMVHLMRLMAEHKGEKYISNNGLINACIGGHFDLVTQMVDDGATNIYESIVRACENGRIRIALHLLNIGDKDPQIYEQYAQRLKNKHVTSFDGVLPK